MMFEIYAFHKNKFVLRFFKYSLETKLMALCCVGTVFLLSSSLTVSIRVFIMLTFCLSLAWFIYKVFTNKVRKFINNYKENYNTLRISYFISKYYSREDGYELVLNNGFGRGQWELFEDAFKFIYGDYNKEIIGALKDYNKEHPNKDMQKFINKYYNDK